MLCNICGSPLGTPVYEALAGSSLTSLCERRDEQVRVWFCEGCGHLRGECLRDERHYYQVDYRILLDSDDEDQIYEVRDGHITYRTDHQIKTLQNRVDLSFNAKLLDYGCAKGSMVVRLLAARPDLQVHLFDVSPIYRERWRHIVPDNQQAVVDTPTDWLGRFDVVTSFFALEHISEPLDTVRRVASLLTPEGVFYGIVPDTFGNVADLVVIDHVNHFTSPSLHRMLRDSGFRQIVIENDVHRGALVFRATKSGELSPMPVINSLDSQVASLASYWQSVNDSISHAEANLAGRSAAIYGSGFYGTYILNSLRNPNAVRCILDVSPFRQGKSIFGTPIVAPESLPLNVHDLFIGLNPAIARSSVEEMQWIKDRSVRVVFLDYYRT